MRAWVILLGVAAGFGAVAEEAFADRGRRNHSSAQQHRPHHHQARPHHHHARPHHHHHGHHHRWRSPAIVVAPAFGAGYFYSPGYYYAPPPVIEAPSVAAPPAVHPSNGGGYWYFCPDSRAYYPYVLECPSPWMRVVPN